jgi:hypothetical protein
MYRTMLFTLALCAALSGAAACAAPSPDAPPSTRTPAAVHALALGTAVTVTQDGGVYTVVLSATTRTVTYDPTQRIPGLDAPLHGALAAYGYAVRWVSGAPIPFASNLLLQTADGSVYPSASMASSRMSIAATALLPGEHRDGLIAFDVALGSIPARILYTPDGGMTVTAAWSV